MAAIATFALKAGVWFRRGRLLIVSRDALATACPLSGRNSTYRPVQILEASSIAAFRHRRLLILSTEIHRPHIFFKLLQHQERVAFGMQHLPWRAHMVPLWP